jgi:hypothetical protein
MEPRALTLDEIRQAVTTYAPECVDTFDMLASRLWHGSRFELNNEQRMNAFLTMWKRYDAARPN